MLAHRLLVGCSNSLSVSCPSVLSVLIAAAHFHLCSSFRWCSESPLLVNPETMVSCLLGSSRLFPRLPPGSLWCPIPLQSVFTQPTPVLFLGSELQSQVRPSAPSPRQRRWGHRQTSQVGECWPAPIFCTGISLLCPLHPYCCVLLCGSAASPLATYRLHQ